ATPGTTPGSAPPSGRALGPQRNRAGQGREGRPGEASQHAPGGARLLSVAGRLRGRAIEVSRLDGTQVC
ncbi:hypothetical protein E2320_007255, partial [Naja naja]